MAEVKRNAFLSSWETEHKQVKRVYWGCNINCAVHKQFHRWLKSFPGSAVVWAAQDTYQLLPGRERKNVICCKAGNKAVALVLLHFLCISSFLCSPTFLKVFHSESEAVHIAFLSQGTTEYFCSEPVCRVLIKSTFLLSLVIHAMQRCSTTELGGTSTLKLGSHTWLSKILFSPSISASKCLPLHCPSLSVCFGIAGMLDLVFCSQCFLIQPGFPRN